MNTQELIDAVRLWGEQKGITGFDGKGTLLGQLAKTQEELIEARDAAVKLRFTPHSNEYDQAYNELQDGIGDCAVTLILAAEMAGLRFEDCLQAAYDEIKGRTGKMVDGQFVKDEKK
jgi:NTP pyrophosphatase (non-canonical NTP hydrolase)